VALRILDAGVLAESLRREDLRHLVFQLADRLVLVGVLGLRFLAWHNRPADGLGISEDAGLDCFIFGRGGHRVVVALRRRESLQFCGYSLGSNNQVSDQTLIYIQVSLVFTQVASVMRLR
jgi:hypothetical protein